MPKGVKSIDLSICRYCMQYIKAGELLCTMCGHDPSHESSAFLVSDLRKKLALKKVADIMSRAAMGSISTLTNKGEK